MILRGPHGDLPVRIYRPAVTPAAGLVWAHGGSFIAGGLAMPEADQVGRRLAAAGIAVVSVDYRLAPVSKWWAEHLGWKQRAGSQFPVPQEELAFAWHWAQTTKFGVSANSWSLGGASAGASIAASTALMLRDVRRTPRSIVLAYPTVHPLLPTPSRELTKLMTNVPAKHRFRPATVHQMNLNHAGNAFSERHSPAFAGGRDLVGLPPVLIVNSEYDDLRSSGDTFAAELAQAGVTVRSLIELGSLHGHLNEEGSAKALTTLKSFAEWLRTI